jgi:hypothetical protein
MLHLKNFTAFLNEDESSEEKLVKLARLRDLGLLEPDQYRQDSKSIRKDAMLAATDRGEYAGTALPEIREILDSPEAQLLRAKGLEVVSSPTQLLNGTLVWAKPGYTRAKGWGLGFFPGPSKIRRMTPKGIDVGVWGRTGGIGSMDVEMKAIPRSAYRNEAEFYRVAMKWAANHVDWAQLEAADRTGDPAVWRYYVKGKTKQGYFNDENNRII